MMKNNLIFAMTPLHMLICEKIIENRSDEIFDIIILGDGSEKSKFYFKKIKLKTARCVYVKMGFDGSKFRKFFHLLYFIFIFILRRYKYDTLIFGNLNIKLNYLAMFLIFFKEINTYDDGLANLLENGDYALNDDKIFFNRSKILNSSKIHYTIFDSKNTAKCAIKKISLVDDKFVNLNFKKNINIFLGQPLQELDVNFNKDYISKILSKVKIDFYFPHPRENKKIFDFNYIDSSLIVEDFIIESTKEGVSVQVYGFYSTALINIKNAFPFLKVYYLYDEGIFGHKKLKGVENILNNFKIEKIL